MRKTLGLVSFGCCLVFALACSPGAKTPTQPAATSSASEQTFSLETSTAKDIICHRNFSDPYGVVTEVTGQTAKRHSKHLASGQDCQWLAGQFCGQAGDACDPTESYWGGSYYICYSTCT
jgi:hypothetical protein